MLTTHDYLKSIKIDRFPKETVYLVDFKKKPENNKIIFTMRDLVNRIIVGKQDRFCNPTYHDLKSKTWYMSKVGYFFDNKFDIKKPILITEWEKDWLTAWSLWYNAIWLQWVAGLNLLVNNLYILGARKLAILVDQDIPADNAILRVERRDICWDVRWVLWEYKDLSDAYVAGKTLAYVMNEITDENNLEKKLGAFTPVKKKRLPSAPSLDFNGISALDVVEALYPKFTYRNGRMYEDWKELSGYRYWKENNVMKDFSYKDRPEGNAWKIAYEYFGNKKETVEFLKRYL